MLEVKTSRKQHVSDNFEFLFYNGLFGSKIETGVRCVHLISAAIHLVYICVKRAGLANVITYNMRFPRRVDGISGGYELD